MRVVHAVALAVALPAILQAQAASAPDNATLTAVPGIKVGHHTLTERPTGCTVIMVDGAAGGVSQRDGALAADVMARAIVRAATEATGLPNPPAVRDLKTP